MALLTSRVPLTSFALFRLPQSVPPMAWDSKVPQRHGVLLFLEVKLYESLKDDIVVNSIY